MDLCLSYPNSQLRVYNFVKGKRLKISRFGINSFATEFSYHETTHSQRFLYKNFNTKGDTTVCLRWRLRWCQTDHLPELRNGTVRLNKLIDLEKLSRSFQLTMYSSTIHSFPAMEILWNAIIVISKDTERNWLRLTYISISYIFPIDYL